LEPIDTARDDPRSRQDEVATVARYRVAPLPWTGMADYQPPFRDIHFVLDNLVDLDELCQLETYKHTDPDTLKSVLEEYGRWVADQVAPLNRVGDEVGCVHDPATNSVTTPPGFKDAYSQYVEAGWGAVPFPADYGGGGFPWLMGIAMQELITSANISLSMAPLLTQGAIDLLLHHGSEEQNELYLRRMVSGEWPGTMNLTEPQAGSDVGALRTRAVKQDDGTYRITGTKIFITFGEHDLSDNIVHLVLARTPDAPPGTRGISLFIVPKFLVDAAGTIGERNDAYCVSIEHKMGIKASPTCVMSYGEHGGAVGYLVGEENQGMRYMFTMMNNARLSVGLQGLSIAERSYQDSVAYARERRQGRAIGAPPGEQSPIVEHPDVRRMLMTQRSLIEAMRAIIYVEAESIDLANHHPDPEIREAKRDLVELLTPIAKAWCTDTGVDVASLTIQVHGGTGYIEESGVAQHFRDSRITPIYEGTNGIQALDLVGRKLPMKGGEVVGSFLSMMASLDLVLQRGGSSLEPVRLRLADALTALTDTTQWMLEAGSSNITDGLAGATPYLRMFSLVTAGWLMARQALAATQHLDDGTGDPAVMRAKLATATFFCDHVLPGAVALAPAVTAGFERTMAVPPDDL
jgi:alkylation response protein AidB-like acyl-CoA dehydrogenase